MPAFQEGMKRPNPSPYLQDLAEHFRKMTNAKFIVILNQKGIRYTHPNKELIGKHFTGGDEGPALNGEEYISKAVGISGPSIRAFAPITDPLLNEQLGVVVVGMFKQNIFQIVKQYIYPILLWLSVGLAVGIIGSVVLAKNIKRILHDFEPDEIAQLFREREAMLESLREGVIAIDSDFRITLVNGAARKMLSLHDNNVGMKITDVIPNSALSRVVQTKLSEQDVEFFVNNVTILSNRVPIKVNGKIAGAVATFRDITEIRHLAEELTGVRQYVEGLRAKTHEFMNKLQTLSGLLELEEYEEAKKHIAITTSRQQTLLNFLNRHIHDPKISGLLLGKIQQAEEMDIRILIDPGSNLKELPQDIPNDSIVLILGNLLQNAMDALKHVKNGQIDVTILDKENEILLAVEDNGPGIPEHEISLIFDKGFSTKEEGRGYGLHLIKNQVERLMGHLHVTSIEGEGTSFLIRISKKAIGNRRNRIL
jgi:PAS domain S-box-containing protein